VNTRNQRVEYFESHDAWLAAQDLPCALEVSQIFRDEWGVVNASLVQTDEAGETRQGHGV